MSGLYQTNTKMGDLKQAIESILFSAGRKVSEQEIQKLTKTKDSADIREAVEELKADLNARGSSLMVVDESDGWKITVKESYLPTVQTINPHTELSKSILETLAVIAWKQPIVQSDVIKVRTNKAYDHISELMKLGFINKQRFGRSYAIKVTQKFKDYFDLPDDKAVKELFKGFKDVEVAVQKKADKFEKDIPKEDKEAIESRTPEEMEMIVTEAIQEELGMESFSDELAPVNFPQNKHHVQVYTDDSVSAGSEENSTFDTSEEPDEEDSSEKADSESDNEEESPEEKARRIAQELLDEGKMEEAKAPTRELHPALEEVLGEDHGPEEQSEEETEYNHTGEPVEDREQSEKEGKVSGEDGDDDAKDLPAESFPGEFSGKSDEVEDPEESDDDKELEK